MSGQYCFLVGFLVGILILLYCIYAELHVMRMRPAIKQKDRLSHDFVRFRVEPSMSYRYDMLQDGEPVCPCCLVERNEVMYLGKQADDLLVCPTCMSEFKGNGARK